MENDVAQLILQELRNLGSKVARVEETVEDVRHRAVTAEIVATRAARAAGLQGIPSANAVAASAAATAAAVRADLSDFDTATHSAAPRTTRQYATDLTAGTPVGRSLAPASRLIPLDAAAATGTPPSLSPDPPIIQCESCVKVFSSQKTLMAHNRKMHATGEDAAKRLHSCNQCSAQFLWKSHLVGHIRAVHEKIKPFGCELCGMKFTLKKDLERHKRSKHDGIKPYLCSECSLAFGRKDTLEKHTQKKHGSLGSTSHLLVAPP